MTFCAVFSARAWGVAATDERGAHIDFSGPTPHVALVPGVFNKVLPCGVSAWIAGSGIARVARIIARTADGDCVDVDTLGDVLTRARPAIDQVLASLPAADRRVFADAPAFAWPLLVVGVGWIAQLDWLHGAVRSRTGEAVVAVPFGIEPGDLGPALRVLEQRLNRCTGPAAAAHELGRFYHACRRRWPLAAMGGALHFGTVEPGRRDRLPAWPDKEDS